MMQIDRGGSGVPTPGRAISSVPWPGPASAASALPGRRPVATRRRWKRFLRASHTDMCRMRAGSMPRLVPRLPAHYTQPKEVPPKCSFWTATRRSGEGLSAEDGASDVVIDAPRRAIQEFALRQRAAGVLILSYAARMQRRTCLRLTSTRTCSLRREHVTATRINWEPKSANLRALAKQLNLGLDSFVFLTTAPSNARKSGRARRKSHAGLPEDTARSASFLDHIWVFDGSTRTKEDAKRAEFYRQDVERDTLRRNSFGFGDFIAGLALEINFSRRARRKSPVSRS